jgi:hypothetical protein
MHGRSRNHSSCLSLIMRPYLRMIGASGAVSSTGKEKEKVDGELVTTLLPISRSTYGTLPEAHMEL